MRQHRPKKMPFLFLLVQLFVPLFALAEESGPTLPATRFIDDFSKATVGEFPLDWGARGKKQQHFYAVAQEEGRQYLKVDAVRDGTSIFKRVKWDIEKYPILEWRWRGRVLPKEGRETDRKKNDGTVAVYIVFPIRFFLPDSLKYSWSTTLPVGTMFSNGANRNKILILQSGKKKLGQWVVERRNIKQDFLDRFGRKRAKNPIGIGVITDADQTKSLSSGDYDYFKLLSLEAAAGLPLSLVEPKSTQD